MLINSQESKEAGIDPFKLLAPFEHEMIGSTPVFVDEGSGGVRGDFPSRAPIAVYEGVSIELVAQMRKDLYSFYRLNLLMSRGLGYDRELVVEFADLDPETGEILADPKFVGFWDAEAEEIVDVANPDEFDAEVKAKLAEFDKKNDTLMI